MTVSGVSHSSVHTTVAPVRRAAAPTAGEAPERRDAANRSELSPDEQRQVEQLRQRDREVRSHEQAHKVAGGALASEPRYSYQTGPDGRRYVVDGEVSIDTGPEEDPAETLRKAETIIRAALAPAEPSAQDLAVAAEAAAMANTARVELQRAESEEPGGGGRRDEPKPGGVERIDERAPPPGVQAFAAVQALGAAEFMSVGGRLDLYA